jgi:RNA polymerase sigma factor (sigma-70 family)
MNNLIISQVESYWVKLTATKQLDNKERFNSTMLALIPEMRKYIAHSLKVQLNKGTIVKGNHEIDEFINDLFIEAYTRFSDFDISKAFSNWLYTKLDEIIEDAAIEDQFNAVFFKNIDSYTQIEWDSMEEQYTVDGGGDFVMQEDLESSAASERYFYTLNDVFVESKDQELIERLDQVLGKERIHNHINMILHNLSSANRNLFDLAATQKLSLADISEIKRLSADTVKKTLKEVRDNLIVSFDYRFKMSF